MKSSNTSHAALSIALAALLLTAGCASGPDRVEADFGNSVRAMRQAQTYNPETRANPDLEAVETTEGVRMESALEAYRSTSSNPAQTNRPLSMEIE